MPRHPAMDLGVDVAVGTPDDLWVLGESRLGEKTRLGGKGPAFQWVVLECDVVEATWEQGSQDPTPDVVVPRPDPGQATISLVDLDQEWLPSKDPAVGLRPTRAVRLVDRADDLVLWSGVIERTMFSLDPADPLNTVTLDCVDAVTVLERGAEISAARGRESSQNRVNHLMTTYRPGYPYTVDGAAAQNVAAILDGDRQTLWQSLVDAADAECGWLWVRRDGRIEMGSIGKVGSPPTLWAPPSCAAVILEYVGQDLMAQPTRWSVTRRSSTPTDAPGPKTADNAGAVSAYGDWWAVIENYAGGWDEDAQQAATLAAAWWGPARMQLGTVRVNVTAASRSVTGPYLLKMCRNLQLGHGLYVTNLHPSMKGSTPATVLGWSWTWTAAGGLTGVLTLAPTPDWGGYWSLGAVGASELGSTTRLAA